MSDLPFIRNAVIVYFTKPTRTKQSFKDSCDINKIVARANRGELITHVNYRPMVYGDVSNIPDYQQALAVVRDADQRFQALSAKTRQRFDNDPSKFIDFIKDVSNKKEAIELGLLIEQVPEKKVDNQEVKK